MMNSVFCIPGYYLIEECSPTSAGNNEWFVNTLLPELKAQAAGQGQLVYDRIDAMVASVPEETPCPVFLPFLMGSNAHPLAKSCFVGLSSFHNRSHMLRGIYEGIAFSHRAHFEKLIATRTTPVSEIRLAGGITRSEVWMQLFADILQYPVQTVNVTEAGTLGCAIAAAAATGAYADLQEAAANMVKPGCRVIPRAAYKEIYNKKYALYQRVIASLDNIWDFL